MSHISSSIKPLIPTTSALYLRRLARELNALPDGFYFMALPMNIRCSRASFFPKTARLGVRPMGEKDFTVIPAESTFTDAYGRTVYASRRAAK